MLTEIKKRFEGSLYRDNVTAFFAAALVGLQPDSKLFLSPALFMGILLGMAPRIISIYFGADGRSGYERAKAVILSCIYFFSIFWSINLNNLNLQPLVTTALVGAAFYEFILWVVIEAATSKYSFLGRDITLTPRRKTSYLKAFIAVTLIVFMKFTAFLIFGASIKSATLSFSFFISFIFILLVHENSK